MNWIKTRFKNWFREQCKEAWYEDNNPEYYNKPVECVKDINDIMDRHNSYTVRMQSANGGTIIEVSHFDKRQSEYNRDLFIIGEGTDIGSEISKILVQYKLTHN